MSGERHFFRQRYSKVIIALCGLVAFCCCSYIIAGSQPTGYRVFRLKHISADEGRDYLAGVKIGTVSKLPNSDTLLVTAPRQDLIKASSIIKLVDSEEIFIIGTILSSPTAENWPLVEEIELELGSDLRIGTFSEIPSNGGPRAVVGIHNGDLIAVAPAESFEAIVLAVEQIRLRKERAELLSRSESDAIEQLNQELEIEEPVETLPEVEVDLDADQPTNDLFGKLLGSLAEAEQKSIEEAEAVEQAKKLAELNESAIVEIEVVAKAEEPSDYFAETEEAVDQEEIQGKVEPEPALKTESKLADDTKPVEYPKKVAVVQSYEPEQVPLGDETLELDLPEKLNIMDLIDLVGKYLNLAYLYDPVKIKGDVTLKLQGPVKVKDLYPLLEQVLKSKRFVMSRKGNLITIVPEAEVLDIDPILLGTDSRTIQYGDVVVTRVFKLEHIDPAGAQSFLTAMKLGVTISPIAATKTLIVTGYTDRMSRIEELLKMIDQPGKPRKFRFRQLKYTMAGTLAPKVKALAEQLGTITVSISVPAQAAPAKKGRSRKRTTPVKPGPTLAAATEDGVYLEADERTNRIMMVGLEGQLAIVEDLIDALDVEQRDLRTLRLYEIQHVGAEEVKEKLAELGIIGAAQNDRSTSRSSARSRPKSKISTPTNSVMTSGSTKEALSEEPQVVIIESTNSLLVNATAEQHIKVATIIGYVDSETEVGAIPYVVYPLENQDPVELAEILTKLVEQTIEKKEGKDDKILKTTKKLEDDIVIIADEKTYSLVVYGSKKNQQWISSLIKQLDEYRPQVLLDVTLVEITKNDAFQFDLDLLTKYRTIPIVGEGQLNLINTNLTKGRFWEARSRPGQEGGIFFYNDDHIQALLTAVDTKSYGRIMARPKLLVNDNEEGTIKTENTIYIPEISTTTTAGTGTGTSNVQSDVNFKAYNSGVTLTIQPHISKGDQLRLVITLDRTDFGPEKDKITIDKNEIEKPRDEFTTNVETTVTVPDGTTIILGGLEDINQNKAGSKIPILGDIPIIGGLFKTINNTDEQTRLYVFVKAHILRPGEKLTEDSD